MVILAGCMTMSRPSQTTAWRTVEPPAPLGARGNYAVRRPATGKAPTPVQALPGKSQPLPETRESDQIEADSDVPGTSIQPPPDSSQEPFGKVESGPTIDSLPKIEPEDVTVSRPLELMVAAPARRQLGRVATYRITLRNGGDQPHEDLVVHCRFDDDLSFLGSDKREVLQRIGRLSAGETKGIALSLTSDKIGSHCCQFVVTRSDAGGAVELAARQVCVEFVTRHVEIDLLGPTQRTEGSRAEFNITVANHSLKPIEDVEAIISYDKALLPREASAGGERKSGNLVWRLGALRPLEKIQLQVEFECRAQAHRACVFVDVKGTNLTSEHEEGCVEIIPVPGTLEMRVSDRDDPLEIGKMGAYEVTVQNIGLQAARRIVLEATIPESVKLRSAKVRAGDHDLTFKQSVNGNTLLFDPVEVLAPNARLVYTFEVEGLRAGPAEFRASLTSALSSTAVTVSEPTTIAEP